MVMSDAAILEFSGMVRILLRARGGGMRRRKSKLLKNSPCVSRLLVGECISIGRGERNRVRMGLRLGRKNGFGVYSIHGLDGLAVWVGLGG